MPPFPGKQKSGPQISAVRIFDNLLRRVQLSSSQLQDIRAIFCHFMAVSHDYDRMRMWQAADQPGHQLFLRGSVERGGRGSAEHGHAQFEAAFVLISVVEVKASCS